MHCKEVTNAPIDNDSLTNQETVSRIWPFLTTDKWNVGHIMSGPRPSFRKKEIAVNMLVSDKDSAFILKTENVRLIHV